MSRDTLLQILDLARWAPSGDNTQPWRFEIVGDDRIAIHGYDTREHVIYDFEGRASHMAHGALLETLRLAATRFGLMAEWSIRPGCPDRAPIYDVTLQAADIQEDPLVPFIQTRCVQRRPMRMTPLTAAQKEALIATVGNFYTLQFFESFKERLAVARLLWKNAHLRLTCPEAYRVHRDIIAWSSRYSTDRIPDQAVGVDPLTARLMRWVMQSWERVDFFNRHLGGTIVPRIELDFLPAMSCAAHILMKPDEPLVSLSDYVNTGVTLQRVWLTATSSGLYLQPEMTPVVFRWYVQARRPISTKPEINREAVSLVTRFEALSDAERGEGFVFFFRVGRSDEPVSRSVRKEVGELMVTG